jgi:hypothetical protein
MTDESTVLKHTKRQKEAAGRRSQFEHHWDDLARVLLPRRQGFTTATEPGEQRVDDVYDGTPMQAARSLANTVGAMIRPEGENLTVIKTENDALMDSGEVQDWLGKSTEELNGGIRNPKARFRQATGEVDLDLVVLGTGILFVGLGAAQNNLIFQSVHLKDGFPMFDDEGNPVGMYRKRKMFIWQAVMMFGQENLSTETQERYENKRNGKDEKIDFLYWVGLRKGVRPANALLATSMPYEELWMETVAKHIVRKGGFEDFPFVVPRWDTSSGEEYGRSPGMIALPDSNTLQAIGETILVAGQRLADPPLMAPNDGAFNEVNTFPGGMSYYDVETAASVGGNPFFPMISGANLPVTRDMQTDIRNQVAAAFFKNILNLPQQGPQMTATEIIQRKDEFIREVGPVFGRFETDYNQPLVERSFKIMLRNGAFDPIPDVLSGENVKFEFDLPVNKIKKQVQSAAASQWAMEVLQMAQIAPEAKHLINVDALARFKADAAALPHDIMNTKEEVQAKVAAENAQRQKMMQLEMMEKTAGAAEKGASAMRKAGVIQDPDKAAALEAQTTGGA